MAGGEDPLLGHGGDVEHVLGLADDVLVPARAHDQVRGEGAEVVTPLRPAPGQRVQHCGPHTARHVELHFAKESFSNRFTVTVLKIHSSEN